MNDNDPPEDPLPLSYGGNPPLGERVSRVEQVTIDHGRRIGGLEKDVHEIKEITSRIETTLDRIENNVGKTSEASEKVPAQVASKGLVYFVEKLVLPVVCAIVIGLILKFL